MGNMHDRMRLAPISIFTLVMVLCIAVLCMLSFSSSKASATLSERQAKTVTSLYLNERCAQTALSMIDGAMHASGVSGSAALMDSIEKAFPEIEALCDGVDISLSTVSPAEGVAQAGVEGTIDPASMAGCVTAGYSIDGRYELDTVIGIFQDASYQILSWKATTVLMEEEHVDALWSGR